MFCLPFLHLRAGELGQRVRRFFLLLMISMTCSSSWAVATCDANENVVTFVFGTTNATSATGGSGTWTAASVTPRSYPVGTNTGSISANTITFAPSIDGTVAWSAPGGTAPNAPRQAQYGNFPTALTLAMDSPAPSVGTHLSLTFNRPMDKVEFVMADVDFSAGQWQDVMRVTGYLNGNAVVAPAFAAQTPASFTITANSPTAGTTEAITNTGTANCAATSIACNITVSFANPIDSLRIDFIAGTTIANPAGQVVGFQNFSYCVPKRDLSMTKVDTTPTFIAGGTGTYTLTITNTGGTQTLAATPLQIQDVLPTGLTFINPQAPGGGWTCTLATTSVANDTANCSRGTTVLAANGASTVLTLTVSVSPDLTATSVDNRAKVFGGGDPNKTTLTATGPVANCTAANEGQDGGGALLASGSTTNSGCAFENTLIERRALLTVTKNDGVTSAVAGSTLTYTITVTNSGPSNAPGTVVQDPAVTGLNCSTVTFSATPSGGASTPTLSIPALQGSGLTITPTFNASSTATFTLTCGVTATGS